jgi:AsmA protein
VERWDTLDADVKLSAKAIQKAKQLPIDNFTTRLVMKDRKLTLDPFNFGVAGGQFKGVVALDGQTKPIAAQAKIDVQKVSLNKLLPTVEMNKQTSVGRIDGLVELKGNGDSVAKMLASANGKAALVIAGGEISNMMMEVVGIDLWEMLKFKTQGDKPVNIRCGVYDGEVKQGVLNTNLLVFDTDDTKIVGTGNLDLAKERLDMKLEAQPKDRSLVSLRTPILLKGTLSDPDIGPDKRKLVVRGLSALALGAVNPVLAVGALIETGPGLDSDCGKLIQDTKKTERKPVAQPPQQSSR